MIVPILAIMYSVPNMAGSSNPMVQQMMANVVSKGGMNQQRGDVTELDSIPDLAMDGEGGI